MKTPALVCVCVAATYLAVARLTVTAQRATPPAKPRTTAAPVHAKPAAPPQQSAATQETNATVRRYCAGCHSDARKSGGLSLAGFDVARAADNAEVSERMIRKLQAGMRGDRDAVRGLLKQGADANAAQGDGMLAKTAEITTTLDRKSVV